jgi:predicted transcriptional regulator
MTRTTISLTPDLLRRLKTLAADRGISMAALIREALEEKTEAARPKPRSLGIAESGYRYTAEESGEMRFEPRTWRSS